MNRFLNGIRKPVQLPLPRKIMYSFFMFIFGTILGLIAKILDETASNTLPYFLESLDLNNFFSRIGVWIFISVIISFYSKSPTRAGINVFLFLGGMVSSYYLYTVLVVGFYPKNYMMIWITITVFSPLLAFICWYAKGEGKIAFMISSIIITIMSRQTFACGFWYFDITYTLEFILLAILILTLYQSPKQITQVVLIGFSLYLLTAQMNLLWGIL